MRFSLSYTQDTNEIMIYNKYLEVIQQNVAEMVRSRYTSDTPRQESLDARHIIHRKYRYRRTRSDYDGRRGCFVVVTAVACSETPAHVHPPRSPWSRAHATPFRSIHLFACTLYRAPIIALSLFLWVYRSILSSRDAVFNFMSGECKRRCACRSSDDIS